MGATAGGGGNGGRTNGGGGSAKPKTVGEAIQVMKANLESGKLDRMDAFRAYKSLLSQSREYERAGEYGKAKAASIRASAINKAAGFIK